MLQIFSTYLTLNTPLENIFQNVIDDYKLYGFGEHPSIRIFEKINHMLKTSKKTINNLIRTALKKISSSVKFTQVLNQVVSFSALDLKSAGRATKIMRNQFTALFKLNDYIQTLLAETLSFIRITVSTLAPLLSAVSVIMALGIVSFITFLTEQLTTLSKIGGGKGIELQLIDFSKIIPPNILAIIVSIFLLQVVVVLTIFESNIKQGYDLFHIMKRMKSNITGFVIYTFILFFGYWLMKILFFKSIMNSFN